MMSSTPGVWGFGFIGFSGFVEKIALSISLILGPETGILNPNRKVVLYTIYSYSIKMSQNAYFSSTRLPRGPHILWLNAWGPRHGIQGLNKGAMLTGMQRDLPWRKRY